MMHLRLREAQCSSSSSNHINNNNDQGGGTWNAVPRSGNLLSTPMAELMEKVNERRVIERSIKSARAENAKNAETLANESGKIGAWNGDRLEEEEELEERAERRTRGGGVSSGSKGKGGAGNPGRGSRRGEGEGGGALWVDKYAPDGFRDLLSDEKINREVLRAVKTWDPFVFKTVRVN